MKWIKIRIDHIRRDYAHWEPEVVAGWVRAMAFCAAIGKEPHEKQLIGLMGKETLDKLNSHLKDAHTNLSYVFSKVLEDYSKCIYDSKRHLNSAEVPRKHSKFSKDNIENIEDFHGSSAETPKKPARENAARRVERQLKEQQRTYQCP